MINFQFSNQFKLHLNDSLLIKRNKPELNREIYTHPYCNAYYCSIRTTVLLTISCFYENLDNNS